MAARGGRALGKGKEPAPRDDPNARPNSVGGGVPTTARAPPLGPGRGWASAADGPQSNRVGREEGGRPAPAPNGTHVEACDWPSGADASHHAHCDPGGEALHGPDGIGPRPDLGSAAPPVGPSQPAPPSRGPPLLESNVTPASVRYVLTRLRWCAAVRGGAAPVSGRLCGGVGGPVCGVPRPTAANDPATGPPLLGRDSCEPDSWASPPPSAAWDAMCGNWGGHREGVMPFSLPEGGGVEVAGVGGGSSRRPGRHWQTPLVRLRGNGPVPTATSGRAARVSPAAPSAGVAALACALAGGGRWEGGHAAPAAGAAAFRGPPPRTPPSLDRFRLLDQRGGVGGGAGVAWGV